MNSCSSDITIPIMPFVQQPSSVILLTLLCILLRAEKVLGRENRMNLFYDYEKVLGRKNRMNLFYDYCTLFQNINCEKFLTTALHHSLV